MSRLATKLEKIGRDPKITARSVGLRYALCSDKGIFRIRRKEKFLFRDSDGNSISDPATLERITKLVIPPAWENVWISPFENGHLQVTGIDAKGRKQYRYHSDWNKIRNQSKFFRLRRFASALPNIRNQVEKDLARTGLPFEKIVSLVVKLIELTHIRIGNDAYKKLYGSFGLTTLRDKHVKFEKAQVRFEFVGKKGVSHSINLQSRKLANLVKRCKDIPGQDLFQYYDEKSERHTIGSADVNKYIKEVAGEDFTAKDFRAWAGSVNALRFFREAGEFSSETQCKRNVVEVLDQVAAKLGNTRTVCRKYYVDPAVISAYEQGQIHRYQVEENVVGNNLNPDEEALVRLLESEGVIEVAC